MRFFDRFVSILISLLLLLGCAPARSTPADAHPVTLHVFAAASLVDAFTRLARQFEQKTPGVKVDLNFGGSQQLAYQINEGAPADVFASANQKQMDVVMQDGRIAAGAAHVLAKNRLVVIVPRKHTADVQSLRDLARPGLKLVLAAKEVPAGQYALDMLDKASQDPVLGSGYKAAVLKNVISYEENVRSVFNKVSLGEADAGIVYTSDAAAAGPEQVEQIPIPVVINVDAEYVIAPLKDSRQPDFAQALVDYLLSAEGQSVLAQYGFLANP